MEIVTVLIVFGIVLLAELPDKTMFASLMLGTRFAARWVFLGAAAAFLVHVVIAVSAGSLLTLLPSTVLDLVVAGLFLIGAAFMLNAARAGAGGIASSFGVIFLGEWGDITQIATANLAAKYHDPIAVGIGAVLGLWTAALLAITAGKTLLRYLHPRVLHLAGAVIFLGLAIFSLVEALT